MQMTNTSDTIHADARRGLGKTGENLAAQLLVNNGFLIIDRNWRCSRGELDIIAQERSPDYSQGGKEAAWLVIVEVRTRRGYSHGTAKEAVNARKQAKLREVASCYVQESGWRGPWRIDVVAVQMDGRGKLVSVDHLRNAVTG